MRVRREPQQERQGFFGAAQQGMLLHRRVLQPLGRVGVDLGHGGELQPQECVERADLERDGPVRCFLLVSLLWLFLLLLLLLL